MICHSPFIVGAGCITPSKMKSGSIALSKFWGGEALEISASEKPEQILNSLSFEERLVYLQGDAGMVQLDGSSWLEALGYWKIPTVLFAIPLPNGEIAGSVPAYVSLCKTFSVPLLGVIQLGGIWLQASRRSDCLPWLGHFSDAEELNAENVNSKSLGSGLYIEDIVSLIRKRLILLS